MTSVSKCKFLLASHRCICKIFFTSFFNYSSLTPEQRAEQNGIVMFKIEHRDFMGVTNEFISEALVHFKDIPSTQLENGTHNLPQFKLNMTVPKSLGTYLIFSKSITDNKLYV